MRTNSKWQKLKAVWLALIAASAVLGACSGNVAGTSKTSTNKRHAAFPGTLAPAPDAERPEFQPSLLSQELDRESSVVRAAGTTTADSMIDKTNGRFAQISSTDVNSVIVTTDTAGKISMVLYANSYLGWIDLANGDLMNCGTLQFRDYRVATQVKDCVRYQSLSNIGTNVRYANGTYVRRGSDFYHENGQVLRDSYDRYYYVSGSFAKDSYNNLLWSTGRKAYDAYYKNSHYADGALLYSTYYQQMKLPSGRYYYYDSKFWYDSGRPISEPAYGRVKYDSYTNLIEDLTPRLPRVLYPDGGVMRYEAGALVCDQDYNVVCYNDQITATLRVGLNDTVSVDVKADRVFALVEQKFASAVFAYSWEKIAVPLPPLPVQLAVSSIDTRSAHASWTSGGGSTVGFKVTVSETGTLCDRSSTVLAGTATDLVNLKPDTVYRVNLCAINSSGDLSGNVSTTFRTLRPAPPAEIQSLAVAAVTGKTVRLTWSSGGGTTTAFKVAKTIGATAPANCSTGEVTTSETMTLSNLDVQVTYSFRVCSLNEVNDASGGRTISATTVRPALPPTPTSLVIPAMSSSSISLAWVSGGGSTWGFKVKYVQSATPPTSCIDGVDVGNVVIHQLTGLIQDSDYEVAICAVNEIDEMSDPIVRLVRTMVAPPAITAVHVLSDSSIRIDFTSLTAGLPVISRTVIESCSDAGPTASGTHTFTGLAANTRYYIRVCNTNRDGSRNLGQMVFANTWPVATTFTASIGKVSLTSARLSVKRTPATADLFIDVELCNLRTTVCVPKVLRFNNRASTVAGSLSGLEEGTPYVAVVNPYSPAPLRIEVRFGTNATRPTIRRAVALSESSAVVEWAASTGVKVVMSTTSVIDCTNGVDAIGSSKRFDGLESSRLFYFAVCSMNGTGTFNVSSVVNVSTWDVGTTFSAALSTVGYTTASIDVTRSQSRTAITVLAQICRVGTTSCTTQSLSIRAGSRTARLSLSGLRRDTNYVVTLNPLSSLASQVGIPLRTR